MAQFDSSTKHDFDMEIVLDAFVKCRANDGTLKMDEYIRGYKELCRFFKLTGTIFGFVSKDLTEKINILETHVKSETGIHYSTIQKMVRHEVETNTTVVSGTPPSGSRTLLRLHRALEFILEFMSRLSVSTEDTKTSNVAAEVYKETLANYHPWVVQKLATVAIYMLPTRQKLIDVMCKQDNDTVLQLCNQVADSGKPIYDITQALYAKHSLLELP